MSKRIHYGWYVAGVTFLVLISAAGVRATPSLFLGPLQDELGWSPALVSGAVSLNLVLYGLVGPFAAAIMQRFGVRRTVLIALGFAAGGVALGSLVHEPWQLYVTWGLITGIATGAVATVLGATVSGRWFVKRRGLVMGMLTASSATGQLIFLRPMASYIQAEGWRSLARVVALVLVAMIPLVALIMRDRPEQLGLRAHGADPDAPPAPAPTGNPFRLALAALVRASRHRDFWLLAVSFFVCGATTNGLIGTHMIYACHDHGIAEVEAATLVATMGIFDLFGTTASGWLSDRYDSRKLLAVYYGLRGLALLYLPIAFGVEVFGLPAFAVFYGLDWIATVPPTLKLTLDAVGPVDGPIAFGWLFAAHQLGAGAGASIAGIVRTEAHTYTPAWVGAGVICLGASIVVLRIGRGAAHRRSAALA